MLWKRWGSRGRVGAVFVGALVACNAIVGIEDPVVVEPPAGESCILNSDCDDERQVCLFETCSPPCQKDVDCERGEFCLSTGDGSGCVTTGRAVCGGGDTCPPGSACFDGECRTDCRTDSSVCLADQVCESDGACRGPGGGGGSGGTSGTGGAGGTSGTSGTGQGGGGPGGEGGGGDGGTGGSVTPGDPCSDEGAFKCAGEASTGRLVCESEVWIATTPCEAGELCDNVSDPAGECAVVPDECRGRVPGAAFCVGATRSVCGPDLVTVDSSECDTIQHCSLATGPDCAACLPNEHRCTGDTLEVCSDDLTGFDVVETCTSEPCNAEAGACTTLACLTVGARRCNGDRLEECNAQRDGFDLVETCGAGLCDPAELECDVCIANDTSCADGNTRRVCASDGQSVDEPDCPSNARICTGAGQCVACTQGTDCTPPSACYLPQCNTASGTCEFNFIGANQDCGDGYCTAAGVCVECTNATQCPVSGQCYVAVCDGASNTCDEDFRGTSETCSTGYCNGMGSCVQCNQATQCPNPPACRDRVCIQNACDTTLQPPRTPCSGGLCSSSGACVACLIDGDCTQPSNECALATCSNSACMPGNEPAGTPCTGGNGWVCNGSGACVDCVGVAQCNSNEVCHSNACVAAEHTVGNASVDAGTSMAFAGSVLVCRLPALQYNATLLTFGVAGNVTGPTARMVLYADNGGFPSGPPLAVNGGQNFPLQGGTMVEPSPDTNAALVAGRTYWVGVATSVDTLLRGQTNGASTCRVWAQNYQNPFGNAQMGNPNNGFDFNLMIRVRDTQ